MKYFSKIGGVFLTRDREERGTRIAKEYLASTSKNKDVSVFFRLIFG